jgi:hypothetical protein
MFSDVQAFGGRMTWLALIAIAGTALAAEPPRVAAQPLVLVGAPDASRAPLRTAFLSAVARQQVVMVSTFAVDGFLETHGGERCALDEACLLDLCTQLQADLSIAVTVRLDASAWNVSGRTLSCSGQVGREVPDGQVVVADGPDAAEKVGEQLEVLVHHLVSGDPLPAVAPPKVAEAPPVDVPLVPKKEAPPPVLTPAPVVVASPPVGVVQAQRPGWVGPTTTGLWVVAAGTAGAAGALAILNLSDSQRLRASLVNGNLPATEVGTAVAIDERGTAAVGLAAGAATAAASALVLHLLFDGQEATR